VKRAHTILIFFLTGRFLAASQQSDLTGPGITVNPDPNSFGVTISGTFETLMIMGGFLTSSTEKRFPSPAKL